MVVSQLTESQLISIVRTVQAVQEAQTRKPPELGNVTFYGANDMWLFLASHLQNMCDECASYDLDTYFGTEIRMLFPYHQIIDENNIYVYVHPNCGCLLSRQGMVEEP